MSDEVPPLPEDDPDVQRIMAIVRQGLAYSRVDAPDHLRIDTFVIVPMLLWTDEDGDEHEAPAVYGESRRQYIKRGVLDAALQAIRDLGYEHESDAEE
jgi:hypothetical protein